MKFPQEFIDNVGRAAEFSYNKILGVYLAIIGIVVTGTLLSALLWLLGYLPYPAVVFAVAFSVMNIICLLVLWVVLWFRTVNAKPRYEIHNWFYDRYQPQGLWYKVFDLPRHSNKYAFIKILIMLLFAFLLIQFYKK